MVLKRKGNSSPFYIKLQLLELQTLIIEVSIVQILYTSGEQNL